MANAEILYGWSNSRVGIQNSPFSMRMHSNENYIGFIKYLDPFNFSDFVMLQPNASALNMFFPNNSILHMVWNIELLGKKNI